MTSEDMNLGSISSLDLIAAAPLPALVRESAACADEFGAASPYGYGYGVGPHGYRQMPWWTATGTGTDRAGGRLLPLFWSEVDLRGFRLVARDLDARNQFAKGFLSVLTAYHVHKGFGWQACLKGQAKTPYPTPRVSDPTVAKAQQILDTWRDATRWPLKSREAFRRWRRDGEVFGRLTFSGWDRLPQFRFINPELVVSPDGAGGSGDASFGVLNEPGDVDDHLAYHVVDQNDPTKGEWVTADRANADYVRHTFGIDVTPGDVVHARVNVDGCVKRGVTDFVPVAEQFDGVRVLLRNMLASTVRQAGTAWLERIPGATLEQVRNLVPQVPGQAPAPAGAFGPRDPWRGYRGYGYDSPEPYGGIKKTEGDREFLPTPAGAAGSYVAALQASLRGCCVLWGLPEFATGDASNNNFASALVANGPFVRLVEGTQYEWGAAWERPIALKVLKLACEAGLLTPQELARLDVEVIEPQVSTAEPDKDAATNNTLHQAGVLSATTWQLQRGLDPQHEAANFEREQKAKQPPAPQPVQPPGGGDDFGGLFEAKVRPVVEATEGVAQTLRGLPAAVAAELAEPLKALSLERILLEHGFSGTLTDKAGRKVTYQDGVRVAGHHDQGGGADAGTSGGSVETHGAKIDVSDIEANHPPEVVAKVKQAVATAFQKAVALISNPQAALYTLAYHTPQILGLWTDLFDHPDDLKKIGYNPGFSGVDARGHSTADPVKDALGINAHLACGLVTKIGAAAITAVRKKLGLAEAAAAATVEQAAEFIRGLLATITAELGLPEPPPAADIAAKLTEMGYSEKLGGTPKPRAEAAAPVAPVVNVTVPAPVVNVIEAPPADPVPVKKTRKSITKVGEGQWEMIEIEEGPTDGG